MSIDQLLFLVVDALITTLLVRMVLRRRQNEASASAPSPATTPSDDLRTSTTTVTLGSASVTRSPRTAAAALAPGTTGSGAPGATPETGSLTRMFGRGQLRGLATFAAEQNERISAYVRDKWSGVPGQLPAVLDALLTELERDAETKGLWLDRETLKSMLVVALRSNRVVDSDVVLEALEKVA